MSAPARSKPHARERDVGAALALVQGRVSLASVRARSQGATPRPPAAAPLGEEPPRPRASGPRPLGAARVPPMVAMGPLRRIVTAVVGLALIGVAIYVFVSAYAASQRKPGSDDAWAGAFIALVPAAIGVWLGIVAVRGRYRRGRGLGDPAVRHMFDHMDHLGD